MGSFRFNHAHDGDRRPLNQVAFLAMHDIADNVFATCNFALGKDGGHLESLVSVKDMARTKGVDAETLPESISAKDTLDRGHKKIGPSERIRQRGIRATASMVRELLNGTAIDKVCLLIEHFPSPGAEWLVAARDISLGRLRGFDNMSLTLYAMAFADGPEMKRMIESNLREDVYSLWYAGELDIPSLGKVKDRECPEDDLPPLPNQPHLKLGYVATGKSGASTLAFPDAVLARFKKSDYLCDMWNGFVADNTKRFGSAKHNDKLTQPRTTATGDEQDLEDDGTKDSSQPVHHIDPAGLKSPDDFAETVIAKAPLPTNRKVEVWVSSHDGIYSTWLIAKDGEVTLPKLSTTIFGFGLWELGI